MRNDTHAQHSRHGRNVQTKKTTTDTCERTHDILVGDRQDRYSTFNAAHTGFAAMRALYYINKLTRAESITKSGTHARHSDSIHEE